MANTNTKGLVYASYHKKFNLMNEDFIVPIHVGRKCHTDNKDGKFSDSEYKWLTENTVGDDTGINISDRNREFCEATALYWMWKNLDVSNLKYVGCFQYRRQLILNDYFSMAKPDKEKTVYKCVHFSQKDKKISNKCAIKDEVIAKLMDEYDAIIPFPTSLDEIGTNSVYDDWVSNIPGVHIDDLLLLENYIAEKFPDIKDSFHKYLDSPNKLMYQVFITKPEIFSHYCQWLFGILFEVDKLIDTSLYQINGKRTMGYLAEVLFGFYFTEMQKNGKYKVLNCGVTFIE